MHLKRKNEIQIKYYTSYKKVLTNSFCFDISNTILSYLYKNGTGEKKRKIASPHLNPIPFMLCEICGVPVYNYRERQTWIN